MFIVKISKEKQLLDVKLYSSFQNALADIVDKNIFNNVSKEVIDTLEDPIIRCHSYSEITGVADDFEFTYLNGVVVYVGEVYFTDVDRQKE